MCSESSDGICTCRRNEQWHSCTVQPIQFRIGITNDEIHHFVSRALLSRSLYPALSCTSYNFSATRPRLLPFLEVDTFCCQKCRIWLDHNLTIHGKASLPMLITLPTSAPLSTPVQHLFSIQPNETHPNSISGRISQSRMAC